MIFYTLRAAHNYRQVEARSLKLHAGLLHRWQGLGTWVIIHFPGTQQEAGWEVQQWLQKHPKWRLTSYSTMPTPTYFKMNSEQSQIPAFPLKNPPCKRQD